LCADNHSQSAILNSPFSIRRMWTNLVYIVRFGNSNVICGNVICGNVICGKDIKHVNSIFLYEGYVAIWQPANMHIQLNQGCVTIGLKALFCGGFVIKFLNNMKKETIIISLGGSLVAPGEINIEFLKSFKGVLEKYFGQKRFFIVVGGGRVARMYQSAILEFGAKSSDRDWIGINVTRLNAEVVRQLFGDKSYPKIITNPNLKVKTSKDIVVGAGWKPGWSTDYDAVLIAKNHGAKTIVNLSNIDYVYDLPAGRQVKIPSDFENATPLKEVSWKSFKKIVGDKWSPGTSAPFDPIASKLASKLKLKVVMINGKNLEQLENFLENKPFIGTTIS
jgi:uridylate kinase